MAEFHCKESFSIDEGELDGLSSQKCFVLGYELAMITDHWDAGGVPDKPVHPENRDRLEAAAERRGVGVEFAVYHDDWLWMKTTSPKPEREQP